MKKINKKTLALLTLITLSIGSASSMEKNKVSLLLKEKIPKSLEAAITVIMMTFGDSIDQLKIYLDGGDGEKHSSIQPLKNFLMVPLHGTGDTLLHVAVEEEKIKMVEELLKRNAPLDVKNKKGKTPRDIAREKKNRKILNLLEAKNFILKQLKQKEKREAKKHITKYFDGIYAQLEEIEEKDSIKCMLFRAAKKGDLEEIKELIKKFKSTNPMFPGKNILLHVAVGYEQEEIVKELLKQRAVLDAVNEKYQTPLDIALAHYNDPITDLLVNAGIEQSKFKK